MTSQPAVFGEFYDEVSKTKITEGRMWLQEWRAAIDDVSWEAMRQRELTPQLANCFAEGMIRLFRQRIHGICSDALYASTKQSGDEFLIEIRAAAEKFGVDVSQVLSQPITYAEAFIRARKKLE